MKRARKPTDTQMLDWMLSRGWVICLKKKRPRKYQNDTFIRRVDSRNIVQRAMLAPALSKEK